MLSLTHRFGPSAPLVNLDDLATYLQFVAKLVLTVFHLFLVFQIELPSTPELTDLVISGFQDDLSGFIMDQVMSNNEVHHLL
jgi:N-acetyl-beta-hexosaminidase